MVEDGTTTTSDGKEIIGHLSGLRLSEFDELDSWQKLYLKDLDSAVGKKHDKNIEFMFLKEIFCW